MPTPRFWSVAQSDDLAKIERDVCFQLIVKPILSHIFQQRFDGRRFFIADNFSELTARAHIVL